MKRTILICSISSLIAVASWAQQSSPASSASQADIEKLYVALHIRERTQFLLDDSRKRSKEFLTEFLLKQVPGATDKREQVQGMINEMLDGIYKDYSADAILKDMVPIYQRHLSTSDVEALVDFYSTPTGQKLLRELPAVLSESSQIVQSRLEPKLQEAATKLTERLTKMIEDDGHSSVK